MVLLVAGLTSAVAACSSGASSDETAPPPTPLPSLRTPSPSEAASELPDKVDTDNAEHAGMLSKYGIDPSSIAGKLGGLGKLL